MGQNDQTTNNQGTANNEADKAKAATATDTSFEGTSDSRTDAIGGSSGADEGQGGGGGLGGTQNPNTGIKVGDDERGL